MSRFTKASSDDFIDDKQQNNINQLVHEWGSARKKMKIRKRQQKEEAKRRQNDKMKKKKAPKRLIDGGDLSKEEEKEQQRKSEKQETKRIFDYAEDDAMDAFEDGGNREDGSYVAPSQQQRETYVDTTSNRNVMFEDDGVSRDDDLPDMTTDDEEG